MFPDIGHVAYMTIQVQSAEQNEDVPRVLPLCVQTSLAVCTVYIYSMLPYSN